MVLGAVGATHAASSGNNVDVGEANERNLMRGTLFLSESDWIL